MYSNFLTTQLSQCIIPCMHTCRVLLSSESSSAVANSAAFVSVDESRYTIILAAVEMFMLENKGSDSSSFFAKSKVSTQQAF